MQGCTAKDYFAAYLSLIEDIETERISLHEAHEKTGWIDSWLNQWRRQGHTDVEYMEEIKLLYHWYAAGRRIRHFLREQDIRQCQAYSR